MVFKEHCPKDWRLKQKIEILNKKSTDVDKLEKSYYEDGYFEVDPLGFQSMYRLIFLLCSGSAIPLRGYPYCICLFYVFLNVDVVQHILEALRRSCKLIIFNFFLFWYYDLMVFIAAIFIYYLQVNSYFL